MSESGGQDEPVCISQHPAFARWFTREAIAERRGTKTTLGPCADCGKPDSVIGPDPFHEIDRPLCFDHFSQRMRRAKELLAAKLGTSPDCLTFNVVFLPKPKRYLLKMRTSYSPEPVGPSGGGELYGLTKPNGDYIPLCMGLGKAGADGLGGNC